MWNAFTEILQPMEISRAGYGNKQGWLHLELEGSSQCPGGNLCS